MSTEAKSKHIDVHTFSMHNLYEEAKDTLIGLPSARFFYRAVHYFKASSIIENKIKQLFQSKFLMHGRNVFHKVWDHALHQAEISWPRTTKVNVELIQKIDESFQKIIVYQGSGIRSSHVIAASPEVHSMMQYLVGSESASLKWLSERTLKAVTICHDQELLKGMEEEIKAYLFECSQNPPIIGSSKERVFQAFVGHLIALIPYCYCRELTEFIIPVRKEHGWEPCRYYVEKKLEISADDSFTPIPFYTLLSLDADPILTCLGTTYPAAEGFLQSLLADFTPGYSIGHAPYLKSKNTLRDWIENKQNISVYGTSLGGAFSFFILKEFTPMLKSVNAYSPAGLYPDLWIDRYDDGVKVNIYTQHADFIPLVGHLPEGDSVSVYHMIRGEDGSSENFLASHARVYAGAEYVTMLKLSPSLENKRFLRRIITPLHRKISYLVYLSLKGAHFGTRIGAFFFSKAKVSFRALATIKPCKPPESSSVWIEQNKGDLSMMI